MSNRFFRLFILLCAAMLLLTTASMLLSGYVDKRNKIMPEDFVYIKDIAPEIVSELRFYGNDNFMGKPVDGYAANAAIAHQATAQALAGANEAFMAKGYVIKIWDAYRPQAAVEQFQRWLIGSDNPQLKAQFYPRHSKPELARLGFMPGKSRHSRGGAVDITLLDRQTGQELDMGGPYAYMDEQSSQDAILSPEQRANRQLLYATMEAHGFSGDEQFWWHFHLRQEPYPDTYFNFPITTGDHQ